MGAEQKYLRDLIEAYLQSPKRPLAAPPELDWKLFAEMLIDHKLAGTLPPLVDREGLDPKLNAWLESVYDSFAKSTVLRLLHLERVLAALTEAGCRPIVLKGGVLATTYYERPQDRYLNDLDVLVDRPEVEAACFAMGELGLDFVDTQAMRLYYEKYHFHWIMGDKKGNVVEIHWDLNLVESIYRFDLEGLRSRAMLVDLNGTEMKVPEPVDMLLHIVTQSIEGGFHELRHLVDAALILPRIDQPELLVRRARQQNMQVALWALLYRLSCWTDVAIPPELLGAIEPRGLAAGLLKRILDDERCARRPSRKGHPLNQHFNWLCAPTSRLRWKMLWRFLFPGESHWLEHGVSPSHHAHGWSPLKLWLVRFRSLLKLAAFWSSPPRSPEKSHRP